MKKMKQLSEHFRLEEFTDSATADKLGIKNEPNPEQAANIARLVKDILQPARDMLNMPITVSSGFRSAELNKALPDASATSQHCKGEAADLDCADNAALFKIINDNFVFDQLIWEFGDGNQPDWVHVSLKEYGNRNEVRKTVKVNGETKYLKL